MIAERARVPGLASEFQLAVERARRGGARLLDLTGSNPTRLGLDYDPQTLANAFQTVPATRYRPESFGLPSTREHLATLGKREGQDVDASGICLTSSTSEAYSYLLKLLCDPGDEVLVPAPSYPLIEQLVRYEGVRPRPYRVAYDGAFYIDFDSLRANISERSRAVIVVSPNNPTGSVVTVDEQRSLGRLALPIIHDEVFAGYALEPNTRLSRGLRDCEQSLVFSLDGLSKRALLPQLKLAWICASGPDRLLKPALRSLEFIADTYLSPNALVQHALPELLLRAEEMRTRALVRIRGNLATLSDCLRGTALTVLPPTAGWSVVIRLPRVLSERDWVFGLLEQHQLLVQPGWFYDFAVEAHMVLSLLTPEDVFARGIRRLCEFAELVV